MGQSLRWDLSPWENSNPTREAYAAYSVVRLKSASNGMTALRELFSDGVASELNFVFFSTDGSHGSYTTIEDVEQKMPDWSGGVLSEITFLIIQPQRVTMRCGTCMPQSPDDVLFLKKLRASSFRAMMNVGMTSGVIMDKQWHL